MAVAEPERELIRRISPFALPVAALALAVGTLLDGPAAGWSAAVGIAVVYLNFLAHGSSLAWAAGISPVVLYAVGLGGFILRLAVIVVVIIVLEQLAWFSVTAFVAALVPCTVALLGMEMKLLSGRMQADLWTFPAAGGDAGR
ncbi:MAG: hypothetical protein H0W82_00765 [Actinobacteria bacterium]|nr:hypothetical protein [Actinomycetota bacterium]